MYLPGHAYLPGRPNHEYFFAMKYTSTKRFRSRQWFLSFCLACLTSIGLWVISSESLPNSVAETLPADPTVAVIGTPKPIVGFGGRGDQRDADLYPSLAFDEKDDRYLMVWQTTANADSRNDGFDIYGVFLDLDGGPVSRPFRISDSNNVARSSRPTVVAGSDGFMVAWTRRGSSCGLVVQQVMDARPQPDMTIGLGATANLHSPDIIYNSERERYVVTVVNGDDYLPPKLFSADVADCGDNENSSSHIEAVEFHIENAQPVVDAQLVVSETNGGAFRPKIALNASFERYLVTWEDRRIASGEANFFEIYAQRLDYDMTAAGNNVKLSSGGHYLSTDTSATWTPRPVVAASATSFLTTWYERESTNDVAVWNVRARLVSDTGEVLPTIQVAQMTFSQAPDGNAPTGFLGAVFNAVTDEYLIAMSSHTETLWGYLSSVRVQRISTDGQLRRSDGTLRPEPGVGDLIDAATR